MTVEEKRQLELKTMRQIIGIYCHDKHHMPKGQLCEDCEQVWDVYKRQPVDNAYTADMVKNITGYDVQGKQIPVQVVKHEKNVATPSPRRFSRWTNPPADARSGNGWAVQPGCPAPAAPSEMCIRDRIIFI